MLFLSSLIAFTSGVPIEVTLIWQVKCSKLSEGVHWSINSSLIKRKSSLLLNVNDFEILFLQDINELKVNYQLVM